MAISELNQAGHGTRFVFRTEQDQFVAGRFGMLLFLGGVGMLFGAMILGILAIRLDDSSWPSKLPPLPPAVWWSTGALVLSSMTMQWAIWSSRKGQAFQIRLSLGLTLLLGVSFLASQTIAWFEWDAAIQSLIQQEQVPRLAVTGFHVLTGLHAAHLIGGLIPLAVVTITVIMGAWHAGRVRGIHYIGMYWHFMDIVWVSLVLTLLLVL
ncbi:MAG: hypothetical protein CMJ39_03095 [Phycisphaerae bacterium]|nr:hypothetical protein [Phycisphaerae bacterium]|tara:strand:+ start:657 stop:1283 length:627 start_codon:yes stop_codon:yes gene_type:complete